MPNVQALTDSVDDRLCACKVGVGIHASAAEVEETFPWPACHRWDLTKLAAKISAVPGFGTVTTADLRLTRSATEAQWETDVLIRECPGMSGVEDEYMLILDQQTYGWRLRVMCVNDPAGVNCDDEVYWVFTTPTVLAIP